MGTGLSVTRSVVRNMLVQSTWANTHRRPSPLKEQAEALAEALDWSHFLGLDHFSGKQKVWALSGRSTRSEVSS